MADEQLEQPQLEAEDEQSGDYTGPKGTTDLPTDMVSAIQTICRKADQRELQARIQQVARVQKNRLFLRGQQHLKREKGSEGANGSVYAPISTEGDDEDKMLAFNIYLANGKSFIATFSQAPLGIRAEPSDPMIASDVESAREADSFKRIVCKVNDQRELQKQIARLCWTDGVVFFYQRMVTSPKYGLDPEGSPRSYPEIEVGGALEWKVPIACGDFDDWDYVRRQREVSVAKAKSKYPDKAKKISSAVGGSSKDTDYSRQARISCAEGLGLQSQSGDAQQFSTTESWYWLRPSAFEDAEDETMKSELKDWFPKGGYFCFVGDTYIESRDESMDDHIVPLKAGEGDGWAVPGLGDIEIPVQETYNDLSNLARITFLRGVPHSFFDEKMIPAEARKNQVSRPGEAHPVELAPGDNINEKFYQEAPAEAPVTMVGYLDNLQGPLSQFLTGQQPALFGGEMGEAGDTAKGYQQALAQAMGLMGIVWVPFKKAWAKVMEQCVAAAAEFYPSGTTLATVMSKNNGDQETVKVSADNLKGKIRFTFETDENFPESWTAKRAAYSMLMAQSDKNPELAAVLAHPDNQRLAKDLVGIPELTIPGADSCEKQMQEIEEMEHQAPVPDPNAVQMMQQAQMNGTPVPPEMAQSMPTVSSVEIQKRDDDAIELATCVRWLNSPAGQKAYRENKDWYDNVSLHADAHEARMQSKQQGQQEKPPSQSINFKDLPPDGQVQLAAKADIHLDAAAMAQQKVLEQQQSLTAKP